MSSLEEAYQEAMAAFEKLTSRKNSLEEITSLCGQANAAIERLRLAIDAEPPLVASSEAKRNHELFRMGYAKGVDDTIRREKARGEAVPTYSDHAEPERPQAVIDAYERIDQFLHRNVKSDEAYSELSHDLEAIYNQPAGAGSSANPKPTDGAFFVVPEGWALVPLVPTPDMLSAAHDAEHCGFPEPHFANAYAAMVSKTPSASKAVPVSSLTKDQIREIFLANGFTVKEGQSDLKDYVYAAAYALLGAVGAQSAEQTHTVLWNQRKPEDSSASQSSQIALENK